MKRRTQTNNSKKPSKKPIVKKVKSCAKDDDDDSKKEKENVLPIDEDHPKEKEEEEKEPTLVPIVWKGFERRQHYSAMFHSIAAPFSEIIEVTVAGAPCPLQLQRSVLKQAHCSLFDCYLSTSDTIPISQETLDMLYGTSPESWNIVWSYLGLLYGLCVVGATATSGKRSSKSPIWIQTRHGLSMPRLIHVILLCDYLHDNATLRLLGQSLESFFASGQLLSLRDHVNLIHDEHGDIDLHKCLIDPDDDCIPLDKDLAYVLFSQYHHFGLSDDSILFKKLYEETRYLTTSELFESPPITQFLRDVLMSNMVMTEEKTRDTLVTLIRHEQHYYIQGEFEACGEREQDAFQDCFIPVSVGLWKKLWNLSLRSKDIFSDTHTITLSRDDYPRLAPPLRSKLGTGLYWLGLYWTLVFPALSSNLQKRLFVSGSLIPMCLLTFHTHNFRDIVTRLFPESDMDVYVSGEDGEQIAQQVEEYLKKQHEHLYEERRTQFHGTTVITLVLPFHPLFDNQSLRVQIIYYCTSVTPAQVVTYHHLCPVRAYYLPSTHEVVAAPSALLCWTTGYMSYYRLRCCRDTTNPLYVLKYLIRKFGVWNPMISAGTDQNRLSVATKQIRDLFSEDAHNLRGKHNILLALYPKYHIDCPDGKTLSLTTQGMQVIKDIMKKRNEFY